jgi:hypothetical protein
VHADTITDRFNRLVDRAEVKRIRLHDVRYTYATTSLDSGVEPKIVADRIGHANMAYTLSIYTHRSTGKTAAQRRSSPGCSSGPDGCALGVALSTSAPRPRAGYARRAKLADLSGVCYRKCPY